MFPHVIEERTNHSAYLLEVCGTSLCDWMPGVSDVTGAGIMHGPHHNHKSEITAHNQMPRQVETRAKTEPPR